MAVTTKTQTDSLVSFGDIKSKSIIHIILDSLVSFNDSLGKVLSNNVVTVTDVLVSLNDSKFVLSVRSYFDMHLYLQTASPDNNVLLNITPQDVFSERGNRHQIIHIMDDGSEERIDLSTKLVFYITLMWENLSRTEASEIFNFWCDEYKGNGITKTFKWTHPIDGHTYVVRFDSDIERSLKVAEIYGFARIQLKVLGKIGG